MHYTEVIAKAINLNSRGVYDWIQRNYGKPLPNWAKGFEANSSAKLQMQNFVAAKMEAATNSAQFLVDFLKAIPNK